MCMKNVNINGFVCGSVLGENEIPSFLGVSDVLYGKKDEEGVVCVDSFYIVVFANIIQAREEENLFTNYECSMRITSFAGKTTEVARFKLGENAKIIEKEEGIVCRNFATNKFFLALKDYPFPDGEGQYILKILIRKKDEINNAIIENDTQFMMSLHIATDLKRGIGQCEN